MSSKVRTKIPSSLTLKSTRDALKVFEKNLASNPTAAKTALVKLGTHTRAGAVSPRYKS